MRTQNLKGWFIVSGGMCLMASVLLLMWAVLWPCGVAEAPKNLTVNTTRGTVSHQLVAARGLNEFEPLWNRRLQQPLGASATKQVDLKPTIAEPLVTPLTIRLLGTVVEPGRTLAMFSTGPAQIEFKGVGQAIGSGMERVEVVEIYRRQAVVRFRGQLIKVAIEGSEDS